MGPFASRITESILHVNKWQLNRPIIKLLKDIMSQRLGETNTVLLICLCGTHMRLTTFMFSLLFELIYFEVSLLYPHRKVTCDQVGFPQTHTHTR